MFSSQLFSAHKGQPQVSSSVGEVTIASLWVLFQLYPMPQVHNLPKS